MSNYVLIGAELVRHVSFILKMMNYNDKAQFQISVLSFSITSFNHLIIFHSFSLHKHTYTYICNIFCCDELIFF